MRSKRKILLSTWAITLGMLFLISAAGLAMDADDAPETIDIDILSELYGPVSFDHAAHTEITQCSHCHHHTT